ncbi:MAG: LpxI family protein [Fusobacteriaceae bacterium]
MEKIGIIVGNGKLPLYFLREAEKKELEIYPIGLFSSVELEIQKHPNYKEFNIGEVGNIVKFFLKNSVSKVVMLGKVEKSLIFKNLKFDKFGQGIMEKLPDKKDETLLFAVILFFKLNGIKILPQSYLLNSFIFEKKCYTTLVPNDEELKTIKIGIEAALALSKVDAGQSVVCKDMSVIALEGVEGTDKTIARGGELAGENTILIKMARPQQDMRVDIPAVGVDTIKKLVEIGARGIVAQAGKMIFLEQESAIKLANENHMFIIGR